MSEAAIGVAIRSCPGVQPRRSYSRLHAIIADSASFANSADRFANNFASDTYGCPSKDDLQQIAKNPTDETELPMIKQHRAYYLLRGDIVNLVLEDPASGISRIHVSTSSRDARLQSPALLPSRSVDNRLYHTAAEAFQRQVRKLPSATDLLPEPTQARFGIDTPF